MLEKRYQVKPFLFTWVAGLLGALLIVKILFRPWVIQNSNWRIAEILVFSFPSYVESFLVSALLFVAMTLSKRLSFSIIEGMTEHIAFSVSVILAGSYAMSQEMQEYNLGGANVVDIWDLVASTFGLATFGILYFRNKYWKIIDR